MDDDSWTKTLGDRLLNDLLNCNLHLEKFCYVNNANKSRDNPFSHGTSDYTDITLKLSNGEVRAHKTVLMCGSPYFRCMLSNQFEESRSGIIELRDVNLEDMAVIIQYIYCGYANLNRSNITSILSLCEYFEMPSLTQTCCRFIEKGNLCLENCVDVLSVTTMINASDTAQTAIQFIVSHVEEVFSRPAFFKDVSLSVLKSVIRCPLLPRTLDMLNHYLEAVKAWLDAGGEEHRYRDITTILSTYELGGLLHKYPEVSKYVGYPPDFDQDHRIKCDGDIYWTSEFIDTQPVVVTIGGEMCGHITHNVEYYTPFRKWGQHYMFPCKMTQKSSEMQQAMQDFISPVDPSDNPANPYNIPDKLLADHLSKMIDERNLSILNAKFTDRTFEIFSKSGGLSISVTWNGLVKRRNAAITSTGPVKNTLIILGGSNNDGFLDDVEEIFADAELNRRLPPLPVKMEGGVAAFINDVLYYVGGHNADGPTSALWRMHIDRPDSWVACTPLPVAYIGLAGGALHSELYVTGGYTKEKPRAVTNRCWKYNPRSNEWKEIASMNVSRAEHCCVVLNSRLYAIGGRNNNVILSSVEYYDPDNNNWRTVKDMMKPRCMFSATVCSRQIIVVGGNSHGGATNSTERYSPSNNGWHPLDSLQSQRQGCVAGSIALPCWIYKDNSGTPAVNNIR